MWRDFNFFLSDRQTTDRQTDKTDCLTPLCACARGVIMWGKCDLAPQRSPTCSLLQIFHIFISYIVGWPGGPNLCRDTTCSHNKDRVPDTRTCHFNTYSDGGYHTTLHALGKSNFICQCHLWTTVQRACEMQIGHV